MKIIRYSFSNPVAVFGILGAVTGIFSGFICSAWFNGGVLPIILYFNGVVFGFPIATLLVSYLQISPLRALGTIIGFGLSWVLAHTFAVTTLGRYMLDFSNVETQILDYVVMFCIFAVSGAIGATVVAVSLLFLMPYFRTRAFFVRVLWIGALVGSFLGFALIVWRPEVLFMLVFVAWQGSIAAVVGKVVAEAKK